MKDPVLGTFSEIQSLLRVKWDLPYLKTWNCIQMQHHSNLKGYTFAVTYSLGNTGFPNFISKLQMNKCKICNSIKSEALPRIPWATLDHGLQVGKDPPTVLASSKFSVRHLSQKLILFPPESGKWLHSACCHCPQDGRGEKTFSDIKQHMYESDVTIFKCYYLKHEAEIHFSFLQNEIGFKWFYI